jgi:NADH dehydrogenase FAD-containing subunit
MSSTLIPGISTAFDNVQNLWFIYKNKPTVVVIGSGWGATAFTDHINKNKYTVKVISKSPYRLNQPRLIPDFKPSYKKLTVEPILDNCLSVDFDNKTVKATNGNYEYDYLVIASGSEPNDFGISGVKTHCVTFKTESDLERLQNVLTPHSKITIIGAGPTGLELAFKLNLMGHSVTILDAMPTILPGFTETMQQQTKAILDERKIPIYNNMKITKVTETEIVISDRKIKRDPIVIWTGGIRPTSFVRDLNKNRPFTTNGYLKVQPNVYALGDVVTGHGPPTAQNAKQQGKFLAKHFNDDFQLISRYKYKEAGRVLDLGDGLLVEYNRHVMRLPSFFRFIFYYLAD